MNRQHIKKVAIYGALGLAAGANLFGPRAAGAKDNQPGDNAQPGEVDQIGSNILLGEESSQSVSLTGVIRDFQAVHPDFGTVPAEGYGHYAGTVRATLGQDGQPQFSGEVGVELTDFTIVAKKIKPLEDYAAMVTVIGAAITQGGSPAPVTMEATMDGQTFNPFGDYDDALAGNVNDALNPRRFIPQTIFSANSKITIAGRSWHLPVGNSGNDSNAWLEYLGFDTQNNSSNVLVLRHGDSVPDIAGFEDQMAVEEYLGDFIDFDTHTVNIQGNQVIYLFELGTTDLGSAAADFQDLVLLVTLGTSISYLEELDAYGREVVNNEITGGFRVDGQWTDYDGNNIPPHLVNESGNTPCGDPLFDDAGVEGATSFGAITAEETFAQWFDDDLGVNLSMPHAIELINTDGVYEFHDESFHPIDGAMFGNEGEAHNNYFTYQVTVTFTYHACQDQFLWFAGGDGAWAFIDDQLVLDIGGVATNTDQYVAVDRLGLIDGAEYTLRLFYAQRSSDSKFHVRTNLFPVGSDVPVAVTAQFD